MASRIPSSTSSSGFTQNPPNTQQTGTYQNRTYAPLTNLTGVPSTIAAISAPIIFPPVMNQIPINIPNQNATPPVEEELDIDIVKMDTDDETNQISSAPTTIPTPVYQLGS